MKISNSLIRAKARDALGNDIFGKTWLLALVLFAIYSVIMGTASSVGGVFAIVFAGPFAVGISGEVLKIARGKKVVDVKAVGDGFQDFGANCLLGLMQSILIFLWSLLFIIPGIVKSYAYSMAYYVKADHPEYGWRECLKESERLMRGNKMKLFMLQLSFIGWNLVGALTFGIGYLWVAPYEQMATAVFYDHLLTDAEVIINP